MDSARQHRRVSAVPALPADAHSLRPRRQASLPEVGAGLRHKKKRSPNTIRTQTTSPQVISSLIDSLSAISASTHNHFENLPTANSSNPPSPLFPGPSALDAPAAPAFDGADHGDYYQALRDTNHAYPDDACEPPVIRTSKPPSGLSPITAPKKREKEHSLKSYLSRGGGSSASIHSTNSGRSVSSFGNISIEPGIPRKLSNGSARTSSESKRSGRGPRSLMYMGSRERLRVIEAERERKRASSQEPKPSSQLFVSGNTIKEEPVVAESASTGSSRNSSSHANMLKPSDSGSPHDKGLIPERGSSLRHSGSPSRKGRKSQRRSTSRHDSYKTNTVLEEDENVDPEVVTKEKILKELEAEEDEVARRIRELKKQKLLRDKIAGKMPVGVDAGALLSVSPLASAEPSPTSTVSSVSEKRAQDPAKALKVLGITMPSAAHEQRETHGTELPKASETSEPHNALGHEHARHRSLTAGGSNDATPLPINYALALETIERTAPAPTYAPSSSAGSSKGTVASAAPPSRSKTAAVGGRSAVGRRRGSSVMGSSIAHHHSASITSTASSEKYNRSTSDDMVSRHRSLNMSSPPAPPPTLTHKPTLKKKRWSHPDLPARAEKAHNDKADAAGTAVQPPSQTASEERPTSADSIDVDVDAYLKSPRLSQKIRHPQTGRIISFSEVGDSDGFAVFVCVGMGLTRFIMAFYDQLAATLKLRLITPDRPGIGGSQVDPTGTPLSWPDDVLVICQALKITKFSLLAHSAGAVYALATSLRMPQHIRGRVHLLAPWIPPSQMAPIGITQDQPPLQQLPRSQRFLRTLPPSLLKIANSTFLSATSASLQRTGPKNSPKAKRKNTAPSSIPPQQLARSQPKDTRRESMMLMDQVLPNASSLSLAAGAQSDSRQDRIKGLREALSAAEEQRQHDFDERLTFAIWDRATAGANPATDLIVCLETKQSIGFRYEDISRAVVIHHGSKDSRVPVDNVRWLGRLMRRCEVRILEGEQHGLMASAQVMGNVLTEMANDWEDWTAIVSKTSAADRSISGRHTIGRSRVAV